MGDRADAPQRPAVRADAERIQVLMRDSVRELFPHFYDERQTASAVTHVASLDIALIEDGTYYVHETGGEIVACGGWSRRNKLYTRSGAAAHDRRPPHPPTQPPRGRAMVLPRGRAPPRPRRGVPRGRQRPGPARGLT